MRVFIFLLLLGFSLTAKAQNLYYGQMGEALEIQSIKEGEDYRVFISGHLIATNQAEEGQEEFYKLLDGALKSIPNNQDFEVVLNAPMGGAVVSTLTAFYLFRKKCKTEGSCKITTYIPNGSNCFSACVSFYLLGDIRLAHKNSMFSLHALSRNGVKLSEEASSDHYRFYGMPESFLSMAQDKGVFSKLEPSHLPPYALKDYGIIDRIIE